VGIRGGVLRGNCGAGYNPFQSMNNNRWSLKREITLGDLLLALTIGVPLIVSEVQLHDRVTQAEDAIKTQQVVINDHGIRLNSHDTTLAVIQSKLK